jgi:hypothetical protein
MGMCSTRKKHQLSSLLTLILVLLCVSPTINATTYWVSPTGSNASNGLSSGTAWRSLDNGELTGVIEAGDTVNILPGTYAPTATYVLNASGTAAAPIVYRKYGKSPVVINAVSASNSAIIVNGDHTVIQGMNFLDASDDCVTIHGDSCTVAYCYMRNSNRHGVRLFGNYNLIYRNVVYLANNHGIKNEDAAKYGNKFYHNTIYASNGEGLDLGSQTVTARIFNNQIIQNDKGIRGLFGNIVAFNNVWGNPGGNLDGVVDSAGGISKLPKFVDPAGDRFDLLIASPGIDVGLDIGEYFTGPAPDMGAFETYNVYYVGPSGNDEADGHSPATAWATIDRGDSLLFPGDTVYILPGSYVGPITITDSGLTDQHVVYCGQADSCLVDGTGLSQAVRLAGMHITWCGFTVFGSDYANIEILGPHSVVDNGIIESSNQYGLVADAATMNTIQRSIFFDNTTASILITGANTNVYNCTFFDSGPFGIDALTATQCTFKNNIHLSATGDNTAIRTGSTGSMTYSAVHNYSPPVTGGVLLGTGSFTADPLLIDPSGDNFRLNSLSPAIDAGTDVGLSYNGPKPDLGAYESGVLTDLEFLPVLDTLRADSQYQFFVIGRDASGYPADYGTLSWSHTFVTGAISTDGLFTPQDTGTGQVQVVSSIGGVSVLSTAMTVIPGDLEALAITPERDTVSADGTLQFTVSGADSRGNPVADPGTISWSVLNGIGSIDGAGLFTPSSVGYGFIRAVSNLGPSGFSDTITVVPGALAHLQILPADHVMTVLSSFQFTANGLDADSNFIKVLTDSASWSTSDVFGNINGSGVYTSSALPGTHEIRAGYNGFADTVEVVVTLAGGLDHVRVERFDGTSFGDTTLSTDNDSTRFYCRGYTGANALIGDVAVTWSVSGPDSIGTTGGIAANSTVLTLANTGTGRVAATYSAGVADSTGVITCTGGVPLSIVISPQAAALSTDSNLTFIGESRDADGNPSNPEVVLTWSVLGLIGTISSGGDFTPTTTGSGYIVASGGGLADTAGPIVVTPGALVTIDVAPDSVTLPFDTTQQFTVNGFDADGNLRDAGTITWTVVDAIGSIDGDGLFTPSDLGVTRVVGLSDTGPTDTTSLLEIVPGQLVSLTISPDSIDLTTDDIQTFTASGFDIGGHAASSGALSWEVVNGIGSINPSGIYQPLGTGFERVIVTSSIGGVTDTNTAVVVSAGALDRLVISPESDTIRLGDSIQFIADGYDRTFNPTATGTLSWSVNGGIGSIDDTGLFVAGAAGPGSVTVTSNLGVSETSGDIVVEALLAEDIPLGDVTAHPGADMAPLLGVRISNGFATPRYLTGASLRLDPHGAGTPAELLGNFESVSLYLDSDNDSILSTDDSLLTIAPVSAATVVLSFDSLEVLSGSGRTLLVGATISPQAHDGDSLDCIILPALDFQTADLSLVDGTDTLNSLGHVLVNGMVTSQISLTIAADSVVNQSDEFFHLLTLDLPRNGYSADTLDVLSIRNLGTAGETDLDSMILYRDDGNGSWGGPGEEIRLGKMAFTGTQWTRSGINSVIGTATGRFFVGARLAPYPTDGATLVLSIPGYGVEMRSANDGPLDGALVALKTITIRTNEQLEIVNVPVTGHTVVPGTNTGAMMAFRLTNTYQSVRTLDSLFLTVPMTDPRGADQAQLDSQIDSVLVYLESDNDLTLLAASDTVIGTAVVSNGQVMVHLNGYPLAGAGSSITISAAARLNLTSPRNGNTIGLRLEDPADLFVSPATTVSGTIDLASVTAFTIDAFPAAVAAVTDAGVPTIFGGEANRPVLRLGIPSNGYAPDTLRSIEINNTGTLADDIALTKLSLWQDKTGDGYSDDDSLLGVFRAGDLNGGYEVTGLRNAVSPAGLNLVVTIDVALDRFDGGTVQFQVPPGGLHYRSGTISSIMTGPDDVAVGNPTSQLVVPSNRITAISIPTLGSAARPGAATVPLLTFALYNGYLDQTKTLTAVELTNLTRTLSDMAFADAEAGQVSLYYDNDADRIFNNDMLVGSGYFVDGRLPLSGFSVELPPESLSFFFVVADLPLNVIDRDSLAVSIASRSDFQFKEAVNLNGDLPIISGGWIEIDGSVSAQYEILPLSPQTLSPGDTLVPLLAFRPAHNGDQLDQLTGLSIVNLLTADGSDVINVRLWQDANDDRQFQASDLSVGTLVFVGGQWTISGLSLPVDTVPEALFVTGDVAPTATPNATFEAMIPLNGCRFASDNDGPLDAVLESGGSFVISSSGLRVTYSSLAPAFSVGQSFAVRFSATNLLGSPTNGVTGEIVSISDSSVVIADSASGGPINLAAGGTGEFVYYFTAAQTGSVSWRVRAVSAAPIDSSAVVQTATVTVQNAPSPVAVQLINTAPTAVTRGQTNVFPMSLRLTHGDTAATSASVRIDSLRIAIEDGAGNALSAADVFDRMVLAAGYLNLTILETVPDLSSLWLVFAEPVFLPARQVQQFTLLVDISPTASASEFVLSITDATALELVDKNSLQPVAINPATQFPLTTVSCRIDDPSQQLAVANLSPTVSAINVGQSNVTMLTLSLRHPGISGTSQIQVSSMSLYLVNINNDTLDPSLMLDRISVINQVNQIGLVTSGQLGSGIITIPLTTPVTLSAEETQTINVQVTPAEQSIVTSLALVIPDSTLFVVRDLSSGTPLDVVTDQSVLVSGSVFPLSSTIAALHQPAIAPTICLMSSLPVSLVGGVDSLSVVTIDLSYPVDNSYSSVTVKDILVMIADTLQRPLDPERLFDRIGYRNGGGVIYQSFVDLAAGAARFSFGPSGIEIPPGGSVTLELVADIEADVPYDHFVALIQSDASLAVWDVTDTTRAPGLVTSPSCESSFPFEAGPAIIYLPAGRPRLTLPALPVQLAYPGQTDLTLVQLSGSYQTPTLQGDVLIEGLTGTLLQRTESGSQACPVVDVFSRLQLVIDGEIVATDSTLAGDSIKLTIDSGYVISRGQEIAMSISGDMTGSVPIGNFVLMFGDSLFLEATDKNLATAVYPILNGAQYPLFSSEISVSAPNLVNSFSNFPNPFFASRGEQTTIAYVLSADAYVDIEVFTVTGDEVIELLRNELKTEGSHQELTWDGRNGAGLDLAPGTYFCRITARFVNGGSETARRKIAVIR